MRAVLSGSRSRLWILIALLAATVLIATSVLRKTLLPEAGKPVKGIVWQVDNATVNIRGRWDELGASRLLIQWSVVDDLAFIPGVEGLPMAPQLPDWTRIAKEPWAKEVILGLAGRFSEPEARSRMAELADLSRRVAQLPTPLNVTGWYFPVEIDPTWTEAPQMAPLFAQFPRPLWVSVYDSANVGADVLADWLAGWLPSDVGVFFQDGVGVHARDPTIARQYADALSNRLGASRLRLIVEAFRPAPGGGFRAATAEELAPQIAAYDGHELYLFDGPHYASDELVAQLAKVLNGTADRR